MNEAHETFRVSQPLVNVVGTLHATRDRMIRDLWTYCLVNKLVSDDDLSVIALDETLHTALARGGFDAPKDERVEFTRVCDFVLSKMLTPLEPIEFKYKIWYPGLHAQKLDCYDIQIDVLKSSLNPPALSVQKDVDMCDQRLRRAVQLVHGHALRRDFLLRFAESPVDFIHACTREQIKGVFDADARLTGVSGVERLAERESAPYKEPWVDEAAMRLL
jgi:SWI/SNF-related matrix-associated actin-dependent regulator of chromatin subfamily D